jgi:PBSX family phage portal protein
MNRSTEAPPSTAKSKFSEIIMSSLGMNNQDTTAIDVLRETIPANPNVAQFHNITFGDPEPVLNKRMGIIDLLRSRFNGRWYEPPIPLDGLSRAYNASPHHQSAMNLKRDILMSYFIPTRYLDARQFEAFALDAIVFGNGYLEEIPNRLGSAARYERAPAKYVRRGKDSQYFQADQWAEDVPFDPGRIAHWSAPSLDQEIYGVPDYVGALQSVFLNEDARLFRRKVYRNGAHLGYILHLDGQFNEASVDAVTEAMDASKGPGNFRSMLIQSIGGSKDAVRIIPVGDVAAKDEFLAISNVSRDDVLSAHRVFPQLIAVVPQNTGGFGSMKDAEAAFMRLSMIPLMKRMMQVNDERGAEVIAFRDFELAGE